MIDFEPGLPNLAAFPRSTWPRALQQTVRGFPSTGLNYGQPAGAASLRQALAGYLARGRRVHAGAGDIVVRAGVTQGLTLLCEVLCRQGTTASRWKTRLAQLRNAARRTGLDAAGILRGRRDRYHYTGFALGLVPAAVLTPFQIFVGDTAVRTIAHDQPVKFASMEYVARASRNVPEWLGGVYVNGHIYGGLRIP